MVRDDGKGLVPEEGLVLVLVQDPLCDVIQFDRKAVGRLDGGDVDAVVVDVASPKIRHVGVPEACEAAKDEHVTNPLKVLFALRDLIGQEHADLVDRKEDDLLLSGGQFWPVGLVGE